MACSAYFSFREQYSAQCDDTMEPDPAAHEGQIFCLPHCKGRFGLPGLPRNSNPHVVIDLNQFDTQPGLPSHSPTYPVRHSTTTKH